MNRQVRNYRMLTGLVAPLLPLWLAWRRYKGKEDPKRIHERYGIASLPRPEGTVVWFHAASVGEANSILLFLEKLKTRFPHLRILLTTGTVTSARLMQARLPKDAIHQYVPLDTPQAVERFMHHWHPDIALWVESEFWPNLIMTANAYECFMGVINARMSERSLTSWQRRPAMIREMLGCFDVVFAQSEQDAQRLKALGARDVSCVGNLKYDASLLPCDENELIGLRKTLGSRPVWVAASTHPGEETLIAQVHALLATTRPGLLTVIVPRHPDRGAAIAKELQASGTVALRSQKQTISGNTAFYIADTLGELGLFYRLCEIVFMGGSLVGHGGQNPLEPARLACAITTGPHTHNFADIYQTMEEAGLCLRADSAPNLAAHLDRLLNDAAGRNTMQTNVRKWIEKQGGAADRLLESMAPIFEFTGKAS